MQVVQTSGCVVLGSGLLHSGHAEFSARGVEVVWGFDAVVGVDSGVVVDVSCAAADGLQAAQCHVVLVFEADLRSLTFG